MNTVKYEGTNEVFHINRYHLLLVLERFEKQKARFPLFEHVMIPFSVLIPTLVTLLTADFKNSLGLSANVWQMFILTVMVLSSLITAVFLGLWARNRGRCKLKTPDEIIEEIIKEMENQKRLLTNAHR
jgi:hypothetical protein